MVLTTRCLSTRVDILLHDIQQFTQDSALIEDYGLSLTPLVPSLMNRGYIVVPMFLHFASVSPLSILNFEIHDKQLIDNLCVLQSNFFQG